MEEDYTTTSRGKSKPSHGGGHHPPASTSEVMSSAKILAGAAFSHESGKHDKAELAGAAADLLSGAKKYAHLDENKAGIGKYVDKAEDYLHKYHSSHSTTTPPGGSPTGHGGDGKQGKHESGGYGEYIKMAQGFMKKDDHGTHGGDGGGHGGEGGGHSGAGAADYIKMAQGFLKKDDHSSGGHGHSSGGAGDYIKLAQGFLKKH